MSSTSMASGLVGALIGAGVTAAICFGRGDGVGPPVVELPVSETRPAAMAAAHPGDDGDRLAQLAANVESLHATVRALDAKFDAAIAARSPADASGAPATVTIDPALLQQALAEAEVHSKRAKFDAMKPGEVVHMAQELVNTRKDLGTAREMLESLLQRALLPAERQEATLQLGLAHRASGDLGESKRVLQQALDLAGGVDSKEGGWAAFQLAWSHQFGDDTAAARQLFAQVAKSPGIGLPLRIEGRWNAAKLGDARDPLVRAEFETVLRECGDDLAYQHIVKDVKARLERR